MSYNMYRNKSPTKEPLMTRINDEFMEAFKHLDIICKDMFQADKGVTTYIDTMEQITNGARYVPTWNTTLRRLKELRHIRNNHSHEVGTSYTDICTPADIEWLNNFYAAIMNTTDPLAMYRKATTSHQKAPTPRPVVPNYSHSDTPSSSSHTGLVTGLVITFIILVIILVVAMLKL